MTDRPIAEIMTAPLFVSSAHEDSGYPEDVPASESAHCRRHRRFWRNARHCDDGGYSGKELVGEIWDEHDEVEEHFEKLNENAYRVDCSASLEDFMEFFDVKLESDSISVGGWVMEQLNHVPVQGESFSACHLEITVSEVSAYRVSFITVRQCEPGATYAE